MVVSVVFLLVGGKDLLLDVNLRLTRLKSRMEDGFQGTERRLVCLRADFGFKERIPRVGPPGEVDHAMTEQLDSCCRIPCLLRGLHPSFIEVELIGSSRGDQSRIRQQIQLSAAEVSMRSTRECHRRLQPNTVRNRL